MTQQNPIVRRYLDRFRSHLSRLPEREREEMVREIESHIAEGVAAGRSAADILERLGPSDRLARAYTADLMLQKAPEGGGSRFGRWMVAAGALTLTSISSLVIIPTLGGVGVGFGIGGVVTVLAGIVSLFVPCLSWQIGPGGIQCFDSSVWGVPPQFMSLMVIILGAVLALLGYGAFRLLGYYFKFLIGAVRSRSASA